MDFSFTPEEETFRGEMGQSLRENPPQVIDSGFGFGAWSHEYAHLVAKKDWYHVSGQGNVAARVSHWRKP